jgi:hypothetical protein
MRRPHERSVYGSLPCRISKHPVKISDSDVCETRDGTWRGNSEMDLRELRWWVDDIDGFDGFDRH